MEIKLPEKVQFEKIYFWISEIGKIIVKLVAMEDIFETDEVSGLKFFLTSYDVHH